MRRRRFVVSALAALFVAAFLVVKLAPGHGAPPVVISFRGREGRLARSVLAAALPKLFSKGNGRWRVLTTAHADPGARCVQSSAAYRSSTGHAASTTYLFARWLEIRLTSLVYASASSAQRSFLAFRPPDTCRGQVFAEELASDGYVVGKPRVSPPSLLDIADGGMSSRILIPSRYKRRVYTWELDTTTIRRGRFVLAVGTLVAEPFAHANQALARELVALTDVPSAG